MSEVSNTPREPEYQDPIALRDHLLEQVYRPEGRTIWLKHAEKQGWTLEEQIGRLWQAVDGVFV